MKGGRRKKGLPLLLLFFLLLSHFHCGCPSSEETTSSLGNSEDGEQAALPLPKKSDPGCTKQQLADEARRQSESDGHLVMLGIAFLVLLSPVLGACLVCAMAELVSFRRTYQNRAQRLARHRAREARRRARAEGMGPALEMQPVATEPVAVHSAPPPPYQADWARSADGQREEEEEEEEEVAT